MDIACGERHGVSDGEYDRLAVRFAHLDGSAENVDEFILVMSAEVFELVGRIDDLDTVESFVESGELPDGAGAGGLNGAVSARTTCISGVSMVWIGPSADSSKQDLVGASFTLHWGSEAPGKGGK